MHRLFGAGSSDTVSELDAEILRITTENRVFYAGPLAGYKMGVYTFEGEPALVTKSMDLIEPKKGEWDTLSRLFRGLFTCEKDDLDERPILFGWWRHTLESLYSGNHSRGLAMIFAGERETGKSLVAELVKETFGKRNAQPYTWMTGRDNFNEELFESTLQLIDDENASTDLRDRLRFGASLKQMVAVPGARCRGLHQKASTLRPVWRPLICLNMEPDRLLVLPPLDDDVEDKMALLKVYKSDLPMPVDTEEEKRSFMKQMVSELPAFIYYLLNEFVLDKKLHGRFGVKWWHHEEIIRALTETSPERALLEFIERYFRRKVMTEWVGQTTELRPLLLEEAGLQREEAREVPKSIWMAADSQS